MINYNTFTQCKNSNLSNFQIINIMFCNHTLTVTVREGEVGEEGEMGEMRCRWKDLEGDKWKSFSTPNKTYTASVL